MLNLFCTATQPALEWREGFDIGIPAQDMRRIVPDAAALHGVLKRVVVHLAGKLSDEQLADRLAQERSMLCVVNSRPPGQDGTGPMAPAWRLLARAR